MEYEVQLAPADRSIPTPNGFLEPLCNSCTAPDCTNPIEEMTVSIAGIIKKNRLFILNNTVKQVASCKGYIGDVILPGGTESGQG